MRTKSSSAVKGWQVATEQPDAVDEVLIGSDFEVDVRDVPISQIVNVKATRERLRKTQEQFAEAFGLSVSSLRNWEQGTRTPERPVALYLRLIDRFPEQVEAEVRKIKAAE